MNRVREQTDRARGDRNQCAICNPRDRIRYDRIVAFFEKHGWWPLKSRGQDADTQGER